MPDQQDDFLKLETSLLAEVRPEGLIEESLFHQLLRAQWTLHRVEIRQVEMAAAGTDPLFDSNCEKDFDRLERYHARSQSGYHRSLRQLQNLQTNRVVKSLLPEPLGQGALPALVKATEIIAVAKRTHKQFHALAINNLIAVSTRSRETSEPKSPVSSTTSLLSVTATPLPFAYTTTVSRKL